MIAMRSMRAGYVGLAVAAFCCAFAPLRCHGGAAPRDLFQPGTLFTGCNYWASHAGIRMWRDWRPAQIERDFDVMVSQGISVVRVFPLWPDFQPLTVDRGFSGKFADFLQNDGPLANYAAVDDEMMSRFRFVCKVAEERDVKLIVGLVTGWMSGRMFVPPAFEGRNVLTDSAAMVWQSRYVRYFIEQTKDCRSIVAWDFGNECNCMADCDIWQMWLWFHAIGSEIRRADPSRPIVSGLHSMETGANAKVNMLSIREHVDVVTTHPYPLWTPNCNFEPLNSFRNGCHAPCETVLYSDLSHRVGIVEEAGSLGPCIASERVAADMMRMQLFGSWAAGVPMYMWWCAFDQDKLGYSPYERSNVERELGLFTSEGRPKPTAVEMKKFSDFIGSLPFRRLPPRRTDAVVLVSERENFWIPSQGAWMLSRQAGFDIRYAYACEPLPESDFYILPSGAGLDAYTRSAQLRLREKVKNGATALITLGNGMVLASLKDFAGCETAAFYKKPRKVGFELEGRQVSFSEPATRILSPCGAKVILSDREGNPLMTEFRYGKGKVLLFNGAPETNAQIGGWPVYRLAARLAGVRRRVVSSDPLVCLTEHPREDGSAVVIAVNYSDRPKSCALEIDGRVGQVYRGVLSGGTLRIGACDAAVFELTRAAKPDEGSPAVGADPASRRTAPGYSVTVPIGNVPGLERFGGREKVLAELRKLGAERVNLCLDKYLFDEAGRTAAMRTLKENSDWFKGKGLKTCAWLWAQLAAPDTAPQMARVTESRWLGGNQLICPLDADFRKFAAGYVRDIAATGVEMILYDDDFGFRNIFGTGRISCLCEKHMEAYRRKLGEDISPDEFNRRVLTGGRNRWRDVWMDVNGKALLDFAKEMRKAADDVDPKVRIGLCSVMSTWDNDGVDAVDVARALAGPSTRPFIRMTGAPYWAVKQTYYDCRVQNVIELSRMQLGWTGGSGVEVVAEGDVYPRPRENCPSAYLELFDMAMRADGRLDGIMKYALDYNHPVDYETGYVIRHLRNAGTYEWIARNMAKKPAAGVRIYEALHKLRDTEIPDGGARSTAVFLEFGSPAGKLIADASIPTVYEGEGICGVAFGENVKYVPKNAFRRGLIIDRRAAELLEASGVSAGLREQGGKAPETFFHENRDGGRFFVLNFNTKGPKGRGYGISRTLADAVKKLSGTPLPAYVNGNPDLYVMVKRDTDETVVGLWNIFADSVIDGAVELDSSAGKVEFFNCTGRVEGNRVIIDEIPPFSFAGIAVRNKAQ